VMAKRRSWVGLGIVVAGVMPLVAQQSGPQERPVFRADAPGVEVDVRVFGRDSRFLDTLQREDFVVLEDGVPQLITAMTLVGGSPTSALASVSPAQPGGLAANSAATAQQTWIFVFDLNHLTPGGGFSRARSAVEAHLRDGFKDGDIGGVVAGSTMVNNRLTSVREELVAAVASVKPKSDQRSRLIELTREWPRLRDESEALTIASGNRDALQRATLRACTDDPTACRVVAPDALLLEKAQRTQREAARASLDTLNALNALASGLARRPGPKTVVLLSDGFVTADLETTLRTVVGQFTRAGARLYAIDVRGLNRGAAAGIGDQMSPDDPAGGGARFDLGEDGPNSLAVDTGGFVVRNENNIGRALAEIAVDANTYYVLGYQPANSNFDGKYRAIEVRVRDQAGVVVRVRARRGYLALKPAKILRDRP